MPLFNTYQLVIFLGVINGIILLASLASLPRRFKRPTLFLGFFILGYTLYVANWTIFASLGYHFNVPPLWIPSLYFLPALAYLFTLSITRAPERFTTKESIYFLPGIVDAIYQLIKWIIALVGGEGYYFPLDNRMEFFIYEGAGIVFSALCVYNMYRLIRDTELKKNTTYAFYKFAFFYLVFVLIRWVSLVIVDFIEPSILSFELQFVFWAMDLACFFFLGYRNLVAPSKYSARLASQSKEGIQSEALVTVLKEEKLYLDPELGRRDLALKLCTTEERVSAILNDALDTTFYMLVNQLRVDESKQLLDIGAADKLTMEAIAKQSGFKSKTTFYKFFKIKMGMNPSEYVKQVG